MCNDIISTIALFLYQPGMNFRLRILEELEMRSRRGGVLSLDGRIRMQLKLKVLGMSNSALVSVLKHRSIHIFRFELDGNAVYMEIMVVKRMIPLLYIGGTVNGTAVLMCCVSLNKIKN